ncbi:MAG: single-stranded DNA-binding protein [Acidobacteriota bacterium]|nr:single-stranded DNA-binding protein [Acidobacteriota bacterium]
MSFNKLIVVGNLGRDPEMRYTPQGTPVCTFSVASNERRKDRAGEQQDITTWFRITVWGKQAENVSKYLTKGRMVYVEGRLHVEEWTDKEGKPRHTLEVNASDVQFIDGGQGGGGGGGGADREGTPARQQYDQPRGQQGASRTGSSSGDAGGASPTTPAEIEDDDIPF